MAAFNKQPGTEKDMMLLAHIAIERLGNPMPLSRSLCSFSNSEQSVDTNGIAQKPHALEQHLVNFKTLQNEAAFPNRLSAELLSYIFSMVAREVAFDFGIRGRMSWIRLAHVCRYWRAVALGHGQLWSNLTFVNPRITEMMLERSGSAPLTMYFYPKDDRFLAVLPKILSQNERLLSVELGTATSNVQDLRYAELLANLGARGPILQTLILKARDTGSDLPKIFTMEGAPHLRRLELLNFKMQWSNLPFGPALTNVCLKSVPTVNQPSCQWNDVLESLGRMPLLERLHLDGLLPSHNLPPSLAAASSIRFARLVDVDLKGPVNGLDGILQCVHLPGPQTKDVALAFEGTTEGNAEEFGRCIPNLKTSWFQETTSVYCFGIYPFNGRHEVPGTSISFVKSRLDLLLNPVDEESWNEPNLRLSFGVRKPAEVTAMVDLFAQNFNFVPMTRLTLDRPMTSLLPTLRSTFALLPNIKMLNVKRLDFGTDVFDLIAEGGDTNPHPTSSMVDQSSRAPCYFPALGGIVIERTHFDAEGYLLEAVINAFKNRPKDHRISNLYIFNSNFGKREEKMIETALPPDVEFDEDWNESGSDDDLYSGLDDSDDDLY